MNKNLTLFNIAKSGKKEENEMMMLNVLKKRLENKQFKNKLSELNYLMKSKEKEWNDYFKKTLD